MKIKLFIAIKDGWDGSMSIRALKTMEEVNEHLGNDEETRKNGTFYDDGAAIETEIEVDEQGNLTEGFYIDTDGL